MNYDLRTLQLEQISVLDELKRVCDKNNLTFYLACGTCIGAMRHKGFIPWDDDIDVFMHVNDFDKLMLLSNEFGSDFFLQNNKTDPGYPLAIARVRKNGTACVEKDELNIDCNHGIYLDIYPIYQIPNGIIKKYSVVFASIKNRILLLNREPKNHGSIMKFIGKIVLFFLNINRDKNLKKYNDKLRRYSNTDMVGVLYGMDVKVGTLILYNKEWFQEPKYVEFENRIMPVPSDPIPYLQQRYGDDVMSLPPIEKQKSYHQYAYVSFDSEYKAQNK